MKITEYFPKLLEAMYEHCNNQLLVKIVIDTKSRVVEIKGKVIKYKPQLNIPVDLDVDMFYKCYTYMKSAGYITQKSDIHNITEIELQLTHLAINLVEKYSSESCGIQ